MNAIISIIPGLCKQGFITTMYPHNVDMYLLAVSEINLFNGQFLFVLKFFSELALIFILGGLISKLLHLDKVDNDRNSDPHVHS